METRARKTLHGLILPIIKQIEGERRVRATMEILHEKMMDRIGKLEGILGASNNKPQMIEDIENKIAENRAQYLYDINKIEGVLKQHQVQQDRLFEVSQDIKAQIKSTNSVLELREKQIQSVVQENL